MYQKRDNSVSIDSEFARKSARPSVLYALGRSAVTRESSDDENRSSDHLLLGRSVVRGDQYRGVVRMSRADSYAAIDRLNLAIVQFRDPDATGFSQSEAERIAAEIGNCEVRKYRVPHTASAGGYFIRFGNRWLATGAAT
jgi:hypothetical protein